MIDSYQFGYDIFFILVLAVGDDIILCEQNHILTPSPTHPPETNRHVACTHEHSNDTSKWQTISVRQNNDVTRCKTIYVTILTPARTPQGNWPGSEKTFSQEISVCFIIFCIPFGLWPDIKEFSYWLSCWSAVVNRHSPVKKCSAY